MYSKNRKMKARHIISFLMLLALLFVSCEDKNDDLHATMECPEEAHHRLSNAYGSMVYLACYDAWGVRLDDSIHDDGDTIGASLEVIEDYKVVGLRVKVDACLYEFDLPLLLADPAPWPYLYVMENMDIVVE